MAGMGGDGGSSSVGVIIDCWRGAIEVFQTGRRGSEYNTWLGLGFFRHPKRQVKGWVVSLGGFVFSPLLLLT